ncbi:MAG: helix-turn-helix domain-containing protein [Candidatus Thiodiazotropha lotti]|nr:helix-turn-helix domain-containing protein [Candidatus Thiodiazotropha lotti]
MAISDTQIAYSMNEAMEALRISRATIYVLIQSGQLRTYKIGSRRFCTKEALIELQSSLEVATLNEVNS